MNNYFSFLILILIVQYSSGQILNGSFEEWDTIQGFIEPTHWTTNQESGLIRFDKDSMSSDAQYSLKALPKGYSFHCSSQIIQGFGYEKPTQKEESIYFYLRSIADNPDHQTYTHLKVEYHKDGLYIDDSEWQNNTELSTFELMEIPLEKLDADSIVIIINAGYENGPADGCMKRSFSWLDDFHIAESGLTPMSTFNDRELDVYPNPSNGIVHFSGNTKRLESYKIYDVMGKTIDEGVIVSNTLRIDVKGLLYVRIQNKDGEEFAFKLFNR
jgi:hypothetical protein